MVEVIATFAIGMPRTDAGHNQITAFLSSIRFSWKHPVGPPFEFLLDLRSPLVDCFGAHRIVEPMILLRIRTDKLAAPAALIGLLRIVHATNGADQMQVRRCVSLPYARHIAIPTAPWVDCTQWPVSLTKVFVGPIQVG